MVRPSVEESHSMFLTEKREQLESPSTLLEVILTSVTWKAWNPYGTLWGKTIATGSGDIVIASITCTVDFLQGEHKKDSLYDMIKSIAIRRH